jgi:ABC-type xylose transport system permease subunit
MSGSRRLGGSQLTASQPMDSGLGTRVLMCVSVQMNGEGLSSVNRRMHVTVFAPAGVLEAVGSLAHAARHAAATRMAFRISTS